jgi:hypothetical protein
MPLTFSRNGQARGRPVVRAGWQMWLDHAPFLIGHIALVTHGFAAIVLSGGCGPHGNSWIGIRSLWNHVDLNHATYLSKWPFDYFREGAP